MNARARLVLVLLALCLADPARAADCAPPTQAAPVRMASVGPRPHIGLALSSGSLHGLAHVGVVRAIEEAGIDVRVVSGTSAGALVGALWASGLSGAEIERLARTGDWEGFGRFSASRDGLFTNRPMRAELERLFDGRPIETWPRRFGAVATNLANGHRRLLMSGNGAIAVQASSAVPGLYSPVTVGAEKLGDGALVEPVPVDAARALGAEYVIAVDVGFRPYEEAASGITGWAFQAMQIMLNALGERQLRDADFTLRLDVHQRMMECGNESLIDVGRDAMRRVMPTLLESIAAAAARRP